MKKVLIYIIAAIITLGAAIFQRKTGPTYPIQEQITFSGSTYTVNFPRSHGGNEDCPIILPELAPNTSAILHYRRYPTNEPWQRLLFQNNENTLSVALPHQPPAGKLAYFLELKSGDKSQTFFEQDPICIRFKGHVPTPVLLPHVLFMFLAMYFSTAAGLFAVAGLKVQRKLAFIAVLLLFIGGMILGPIMQYYAFGEFWTGIPFGWDLTDNKTLIAFIGWVIAIAFNWRKHAPKATIIASLLLMLIFSIPHSVMGSELDHQTGQVTTG